MASIRLIGRYRVYFMPVWRNVPDRSYPLPEPKSPIEVSIGDFGTNSHPRYGFAYTDSDGKNISDSFGDALGRTGHVLRMYLEAAAYKSVTQYVGLIREWREVT